MLIIVGRILLLHNFPVQTRHPPTAASISSTVSEIQNYEVVFEITIQYKDVHKQFSNVEGVKAEKRNQTVIKFYRQKVREERLSTIYHF